MFESFTDIVKTACLALAIFIPSLTGYMMYRREERRHLAAQQDPNVGKAGLAAVGGLLLSESNIERMMATAHEHAKSVNRLARAIEERLEADRATRIVEGRIADRVCDELTAMRKVNADLATALLQTARSRTRRR